MKLEMSGEERLQRSVIVTDWNGEAPEERLIILGGASSYAFLMFTQNTASFTMSSTSCLGSGGVTAWVVQEKMEMDCVDSGVSASRRGAGFIAKLDRCL